MTRRLVVEADGGSRGNPGPSAYGALVRDAVTGELLAERGETLGIRTNNYAEYRGLIAGLEDAFAIDPDAEVEVRLDSKLIVEQMAGRWQIKHPDLRPLAMKARSAFPYTQIIAWTWIPRERNKHADRLVNEALDSREGNSGAGILVGTRQAVATDGPAGQLSDDAGSDPVSLAAAESAPPNRLVGWSEGMTPTVLLLVRHGETELTVGKRFSGRGGVDPGLTEEGVAQAERAAAAIVGRDVAAVVTSPLRRTRDTAEVLARSLGLKVRVEDDFAECAFGEWDGLTFAEVQERWPDRLTQWLASVDVAPPGGESWSDVGRRVAVARDKVLARYPSRTVVVVSHVTPIKTLVRLALDAPPQALFRMEMQPASRTEIAYYPDGVTSLRGFNG